MATMSQEALNLKTHLAIPTTAIHLVTLPDRLQTVLSTPRNAGNSPNAPQWEKGQIGPPPHSGRNTGATVTTSSQINFRNIILGSKKKETSMLR